MDKNHLPFWGRGRENQRFSGLPQTVEPGSAPTCPFSQSSVQLLNPHIPLPALQLSTDTPAACILLTSQALHNLPMRPFLLLLHLSDATSA